MAETRAHRRAKIRAAGPGGRTEVPLPRGQHLDALTKGGRRATEVERSGAAAGLQAAVKRLQKSGAPQKVLQVPQQHMDTAARILRQANMSGTVKNMSGTKRRSVCRKIR